jgi:hypothetical protein
MRAALVERIQHLTAACQESRSDVKFSQKATRRLLSPTYAAGGCKCWNRITSLFTLHGVVMGAPLFLHKAQAFASLFWQYPTFRDLFRSGVGREEGSGKKVGEPAGIIPVLFGVEQRTGLVK